MTRAQSQELGGQDACRRGRVDQAVRIKLWKRRRRIAVLLRLHVALHAKRQTAQSMFMAASVSRPTLLDAVRCIDSLRASGGGCATGVPGESGRLLPLDDE